MSVPTVKLGDVVEILSGFAFKSELFNDTQGMPLIRIRDVVRGYSDTRYSGQYPEQFVVKNGEIVIGMDGNFNTARWKGGPALLNQRVCKISARAELLDEKYLFHFLPSVLKRIEDATPFVTVKHLSATDLRIESIPLPPLPEQRRIAAILDQADALRAKRREALAQLDSLTQSFFTEMFGDPVRNPRGWPRVKFGSVGKLDRGQSKHRPRNAPELLGGAFPLIQTGDVANSDGYIRTYTSTYSELGLRQSKLWKSGTLCITIAANIAKTGILMFDACFPDSVVGFTSNEPATVEYVRVWLSFLQKTLEDSAPESAQKNINLAILRDLDMPLPPVEQQIKFCEAIKAQSCLREKLRAAQIELDALFSSLQHRAFRGEL